MKWIVFGLIAGLSILCDQVTKQIIHTRFRWGEAIVVIRGFFDITHMRNRGAAFSLLDGAPPAFRDPFFLTVPIIAALGILWFLKRTPTAKSLTAIGLSLVLGGALGNFIDRLRYGYVVDFLYFHWKDAFYWPAFNVADSCIVVGVGLLYLDMFLGSRKAKTVRK